MYTYLQIKRDVAHLFQNNIFKDIATKGLANLPALCNEHAYAVNSFFGLHGKQSLLFAHELGHNVGADHDDRTPGKNYVMEASLDFTNGNDGFSQASKDNMNNYRDWYAGCIDSGLVAIHGSRYSILDDKDGYKSFITSDMGLPIYIGSGEQRIWNVDLKSNRDLVYVDAGPWTASGKIEVSIFDASTRYRDHKLIETNVDVMTDASNWKFLVDKRTNSIVMVEKASAAGFTEILILDSTANYGTTWTKWRTALHSTNPSTGQDWDFAMKPNGDLVCIKKGPITGTGSTEIHILSRSSGYTQFVLQVGTALGLTSGEGDRWSFVVRENNDILAINKGPGNASGKIDVHILTASSNYQTIIYGGSAMTTTDDNWVFAN